MFLAPPPPLPTAALVATYERPHDLKARLARNLKLTFVPRLLGPHSDDPRDEFEPDWLFSLRSSVKLELETGSLVSIQLQGTTTFHQYRIGAYLSKKGPSAYKVLDTRLRLSAEVSLIPRKLSFYFPVTLTQKKHADYAAGTRFNNQWRYALWACPELTWTFRSGVSVSLSYETDTFVASNLSRLYFTESLEDSDVMVTVRIPL